MFNNFPFSKFPFISQYFNITSEGCSSKIMCLYSQISIILFLFWSLMLQLIIGTTCVSKNSQKSKSSRETTSSERACKPAATSKSSLISEKSERRLSSEKSMKKEKITVIDSLKVPRRAPQAQRFTNSRISSNNQVSLRNSQKSETESAKTEIINVPLGKAAKDETSSNILTPANKQKTDLHTAPTRKAQFADTLKRVKRRATKPDDPDEKTSYIP
ncbi:uncharacterized protein CELE_W01B6.8 [Caenorhabditis elegans]|uniref:Uncharacterized protein n=1 Tax=Caenorhabditis elegans TaxID=6239 RepID=Q23100_CAEEL|nr:Uncharacterized protein CELE_W01B6.8 [Caenorhabditis elegans]CAA92621.2 Uncharacterized protein CELE_W01B6.8 [Caenorhabditis elegans]|eukprot:NP_501828.2 Uncharacterized protein CELE_W01B6.8 [Caenorhabditis elegans]